MQVATLTITQTITQTLPLALTLAQLLRSYIFHMTFATAVTFLMINTRRYFTGISGTYSDDEIEVPASFL